MLNHKLLQNVTSKVNQLGQISGDIHSLIGSLRMIGVVDECKSYIPEYFKAHEVVPREVYREYGEKSFMFVDNRALWTLDAIREHFNTRIICNTYHWGGRIQNRVFRSPEWFASLPADKRYFSQHLFGRGVDFVCPVIDSKEIRQEIIQKQNILPFRFITRLENQVSWVHFDLANTGQDTIVTFNP